jgi:acyl dehydratase
MPFDTSVIGKSFGTRQISYDWKRPALHALACGAGPSDLDLVLESRGPKALRCFPVVLAFEPLLEAVGALGGSLLTVVHGAQRCTVHRPLPSEATVDLTVRVTALYDKGKGALAVYQVDGKLAGEPLFDTEWQFYFRGEGGFGGDRGPEAPQHAPPEGKSSDARVEMKTHPAQALVYRIASGDLNPLHADPDVAAMAGFPQPILHGLCTFGHAERAVEQVLTGGDPDRLLSIEGRFSKPVYPGQTIAVDVWRVKDGEAYFSASVVETGAPVITLGRALYR